MRLDLQLIGSACEEEELKAIDGVDLEYGNDRYLQVRFQTRAKIQYEMEEMKILVWPSANIHALNCESYSSKANCFMGWPHVFRFHARKNVSFPYEIVVKVLKNGTRCGTATYFLYKRESMELPCAVRKVQRTRRLKIGNRFIELISVEGDVR